MANGIRVIFTLLFISPVFSSSAFAIKAQKPKLVKKTMCSRSGINREIRIYHDNPVTQVGCEVLYDKRQEGAWRRRRLWRSEYEAGYCEQRVDELVTRLEDWGWTCHGRAVR
jgi:hypothetical protein